MPRLEQLPELQRKTLSMFPCLEHDTAPFHPMSKPLSQSKLALVTTAGLHLRKEKPFERGDTSYRVLPSSAKISDIIQSHSSIGFDRTAFYRDMNVTYPVDRLKELKEQGIVGDLSKNFYSFMGALRDPRRVIEETGPEVAQRLKDEGVGVVFLTPT